MPVSNPLFSIIIPTHNRADLLVQAIQSVLQQTFTNWELIIVDDGSTDATKSVVKKHRDTRLRYFYQEASERSAARNHGIDQARGAYFCFLDDDDLYLPAFLDSFYHALEQHHFSEKIILRTGFLRVKGKQRKAAVNYDPLVHQNAFRFAAFEMCSVATLCIPAPLFQNNRFAEQIHFWEDTHLILRLLLEATLIQLPQHHYCYIHHPGMGSRSIYQDSFFMDKIENNILGISSLFDEYEKAFQVYLPSWTRQFLIAEKYLDHALAALSFADKSTSTLLLRKSLAYPCMRKTLFKKYLSWLKRYFFN